MSCNVCLENYNKTTHNKIVCDFCEYHTCKTCCQKYILKSYQQPHCMNCKREWVRKILVNKFSQKFIDNDLKKHQQQILFDTERSLLPTTQAVVEQLNTQKKIIQEIEIVEKQIRELKLHSKQLRSKLNSKEKNQTQFVQKCRNGECRGFLSTQWKCGTCNFWTCPDCHEIKGTSKDCVHTCKTENVETVKLLKQDTKPCPKCGVQIFKTEGCQQMFCTQCHTAFHWKTGKLETVVHNPHYFEWLRQNGTGHIDRNPLDIQCGRELDDRFIRSMVRLNADNHFVNICRKILHIRQVDVPRFVVDRIGGNEDLRIQYLKNEIDEDKFKSMIQRRNKQHNKNHEIINILGMFVSTITDIIYRYVDNLKTTGFNNTIQYKNEIDNLRDYVNNHLEEIGNVYKNKVYKINGYFVLV